MDNVLLTCVLAVLRRRSKVSNSWKSSSEHPAWITMLPQEIQARIGSISALSIIPRPWLGRTAPTPRPITAPRRCFGWPGRDEEAFTRLPEYGGARSNFQQALLKIPLHYFAVFPWERALKVTRMDGVCGYCKCYMEITAEPWKTCEDVTQNFLMEMENYMDGAYDESYRRYVDDRRRLVEMLIRHPEVDIDRRERVSAAPHATAHQGAFRKTRPHPALSRCGHLRVSLQRPVPA